MSTGITDQELVRQALTGHPQAAQLLLSRHTPSLRREAEVRVGRLFDGEIDPDDVMQEFYFKVCRNGYRALAHWRGLTDPGQPDIGAYFKEILRNVIHDFARRELARRGRERPIEDDDADHLPGEDDCAEDELAREQLHTAMQEHIEAALTPGQRDVIRLYLEGRSHAEIAALLDIEPGAARVRLHRALEILRRCLADLA